MLFFDSYLSAGLCLSSFELVGLTQNQKSQEHLKGLYPLRTSMDRRVRLVFWPVGAV